MSKWKLTYTVIVILLFSINGKAQIIRAQPFYRPLACQGLLLDCYPNAAAAYSLRKLKASYSGNAIRIRRDSTGNAETDIGFTANGDLDTVAIKNHCRNNSCMVTTWYNQGDSTAVNFTQTTAASQPRIMTSGVIERRLGDPTIRFDNSGTADRMTAGTNIKFNYLHQAGQAAIFLICQVGIDTTNQNNALTILGNMPNIQSNGYFLSYDDRTSQSRNDAIQSGIGRGVLNQPTSNNFTANDYFKLDTMRLITNLIDNSTAIAADRNILYKNGSNQTKNNTYTNTAATVNATNQMNVGSLGTGGFPLNGYVSEIIFYPSDKSSNRTGIETNINNYYGLW